MRTRTQTLGWAVAMWVGAAALAWAAPGFNESTDIQSRRGNPSPGTSSSGINNYVHQDEQVNLSADDGLVKVLRTDQKNLINDYVVVTIPVQHASMREIRDVLRAVAAIEGGRAEVIRDKVKKEYFVEALVPQYMEAPLRRAVAALDVDWVEGNNDGAAETYIKMQHRPAADVDRIADLYTGTGFTRIDTTNNALYRRDSAYRIKSYAKACRMVDIPVNQVELEVKVYEVDTRNDLKMGLDYVNWKNGPGRNLFTFMSEGYRANQDANGRTSVFDPFNHARDVVLGQSGRVVDTKLDATYWGYAYLLTANYVDFLQTKGRSRLTASQTIRVTSSEIGAVVSGDQLIALVADDNDPVSLIERNDDDPSIQVIDFTDPAWDPANPASNWNPDWGAPDTSLTYYWYDRNNNGVYDRNEPVLIDDGYEPVFLDSTRAVHFSAENAGHTGLELELRPYVGQVSMELDIDLRVNDLSGFAPNGTPMIHSRTVDTTVRLLDGQTYVMSGFRRSRDIEGTAKAPLVGSIPIIGYLFGGENDAKRDTEWVVTITPRFILKSNASVEIPERVRTLERIVERQAPLELPEGGFGYDQWLLGG